MARTLKPEDRLAPDGTRPVQLTDFRTGEVTGVQTPGDGRSVIFAHGELNNDVVLVKKFH